MNSVIAKAKRDSVIRTSNLGRELSRKQEEKMIAKNWEIASLKDTK